MIAVGTPPFRSYSATHFAIVGGFLVLVLLLVRFGRKRHASGRGRRFDLVLGLAALAAWLVMRYVKVMPGQYDPAKAWPLQICDLAGLVAPLALWTSWRPLRALLYYWGIGLSSQAFIQPDLQTGPRDPVFWTFWVAHAAIVGSAIYDLAARGFRPAWRDYGVAVISLLIYLAIVLPVDIATDYNYGYVGNTTPHQRSVVDFLGPWPRRVWIIGGLVAAVLALLTLPWELARPGGQRARGTLRSASVRGNRPG